MKILIIGGTRFLGPAIVEYALSRDHEVILFNRGITNPDLFPDLEWIQGDRNHDLDRLARRRFDAVIDTCGYIPRQVRDSATILADRIGQYLFVSTISVYPDDGAIDVDESHVLRTLPEDFAKPIDELTMADVDFKSYGALKGLCEKAADAAVERTTHVRPGLIVGPRDRSHRFHYWPWRLGVGGEVLAPGPRSAPQQLIDVRDLGRFCIRLIEEGHTGPYNATGPLQPLSMEELIYGCKATTSGAAKLTWVTEEFLLRNDVGMWQIPLWVPRSNPDYAGFNRVNIAKAAAHGLTCRPLAETAQATIADLPDASQDRRWPFDDVFLERERELLARWHS